VKSLIYEQVHALKGTAHILHLQQPYKYTLPLFNVNLPPATCHTEFTRSNAWQCHLEK
jgi:hypothetical protein